MNFLTKWKIDETNKKKQHNELKQSIWKNKEDIHIHIYRER